MGILGYQVFGKLETESVTIKNEELSKQNELIVYLERVSGKSIRLIEAICKQTSEGFVILTGHNIELILIHYHQL